MSTAVDNQGVTRNLNWKEGPEDPRDFPFSVHMPLAAALAAEPLKLPDFIDLDGGFPNDITDQGQTGECTAHGSLNNLEFVLALLGFLKQQYSHKAQYALTRIEGGLSLAVDSGAYIRDTVKVLTKIGAILAVYHADTTPFTTMPSTTAIADAAKRRALQYVSVPVDVNAIKGSLAAGYPVIIGFRVPYDFMNPARDGLISGNMNLIPNAGHCVIVVGYDDRPWSPTFGRFKIRNSWSKGWGADGRAWILYAWLMALGADFWSITSAIGEKAEPAPPPPPVATTINFRSVPPTESTVGKPIMFQFTVQDQVGAVMRVPAVVTPIGDSVTYTATNVTASENGVFTYQVTPQSLHPATEHFRFKVVAGGLTRETTPVVVSPVAPTPPPTPPPAKYITALKQEFLSSQTGNLTVYYSDGSSKNVIF